MKAWMARLGPGLMLANYRAVRSAEVASQYRPASALILWHWIGFTALALFAIAFIIERLS
jgi:lipid-A-disaccharide synthase-like uncharacterized protein